jgi:hypothetical protein
MSNKSIKHRIEKTIKDFKGGKINIKILKDSIELNSRVLEMMAYSLIKELDEIEYKLTVSEFADEQDCYSDVEEVLEYKEAWLNNVQPESS